MTEPTIPSWSSMKKHYAQTGSALFPTPSSFRKGWDIPSAESGYEDGDINNAALEKELLNVAHAKVGTPAHDKAIDGYMAVDAGAGTGGRDNPQIHSNYRSVDGRINDAQAMAEDRGIEETRQHTNKENGFVGDGLYGPTAYHENTVNEYTNNPSSYPSSWDDLSLGRLLTGDANKNFGAGYQPYQVLNFINAFNKKMGLDPISLEDLESHPFVNPNDYEGGE